MATITGTASNDTLRGTWANDTITGGAGVDTMYGGGGSDLYYVDNAGDVILESPIYNNTAIQLVSVAANGTLGNGNSGGQAITLSQDGNLVGFHSYANNLFAGDTNYYSELDIKNMSTGAVTPVKYVASGGGGPEWGYGQFHLTPDGQFAVFASSAVGLMPGIDDSTDVDIFVVNLSTGAVSIESQPTGGISSYHSSTPDISDNGRYVVFTSMDNLVYATDANTSTNTDVYWRDRVTNETRMVSGTFDGTTQGDSGGSDCDSGNASITNDGRYVLFQSSAQNFISAGADTNNATDIFVRDMVNDTIQMITASTTGGVSNGSSYDGQITPDGHYAVYTSGASNLITGDTNSSIDVFRQDLTTGDVVRVNTTAAGAEGGGASHAQITPDGRYVVFESSATNLVTVAGDSNAIGKIFVKDLLTGKIEMVSRTLAGQFDASNSSYAPQISNDGKYIAFYTRNALISGDSNGTDDVYRVPNPLYSPSDTVSSSVSYTLPSDVENLTLSGTDNINATGNNLWNTLTGNAGANILDGAGAGDKMIGGAGNDTYKVDSLSDRVYETTTMTSTINAGGNDTVISKVSFDLSAYTGVSFVENLQLDSSAAINGTGNSLNNVIHAGAGVNVIDGGAGTDTVSYYLYSTTAGSTGVTLNLSVVNASGQSTASGISGADLVKNIESIIGSNYNDTLIGNSGANVLNGGAGVDSMAGGAGNDTYVVNLLGDVVTELAGQGVDLIQSDISYSLVDTDGAAANGGNIENLQLTGAGNSNGTGNALNNVLFANIGNNILNGGAGTDTASYQYAGSAVSVSLALATAQATGGSGSDTLTAMENLTGSNYNDTLTGNADANVLSGGLGNDLLTGGAGIDSFIFNTTLNAGTNKDTISDFVSGTDKIKLDDAVCSAIGTLGNFVAGDARFYAAAGAVAGHDLDDRVIYNTTTGALYYDADGSGAVAAIQIALLGTSIHPGVAAADVVVI